MSIKSSFRSLISGVMGMCAWSASIAADAQQIQTPYVAADTIAAKVFRVNGQCGPIVIWTYDRTPVGNNVLVSRTQVRQDRSGANCKYQISEFLSTPTEYHWLKVDKYTHDGATLTATYEWDRPIPVLIGSMLDRLTFGEAATSTATPGYIVVTKTLLGLENITVPAGTFDSCLKIHTLRISDSGGDVSRIYWRCPNVGVVKQVQGHTDNGDLRVWELQQIIEQ